MNAADEPSNCPGQAKEGTFEVFRKSTADGRPTLHLNLSPGVPLVVHRSPSILDLLRHSLTVSSL